MQSGPYSFAFEYRKNDKDDNGLGMVTPLNEDANKLPEHVRTRTILYLLENCDRAQLLQELLGLPDTLLLFLTKLKRLTLRFKIPAQDIREIQYLMPSHVDSDPANPARIIKTTSGKTISEVVRRFYVQRHYVNDMPADSARKKVHEAEVVLGFPLDDSNMPIIEDQHVFAYLPLKKAGYTVRATPFMLPRVTNKLWMLTRKTYSSSFIRTSSPRPTEKILQTPHGIDV